MNHSLVEYLTHGKHKTSSKRTLKEKSKSGIATTLVAPVRTPSCQTKGTAIGKGRRRWGYP
jgi:hypothetical protein